MTKTILGLESASDFSAPRCLDWQVRHTQDQQHVFESYLRTESHFESVFPFLTPADHLQVQLHYAVVSK